MRRHTPIASLLYSRLFPTPGPADPPNFQTHLARDLIPEIRIETATFYGSLDSIEARYPGLNYCHAPHRMRLGRFPHHARLFETIDNLGITDQEIKDLARWEGTLWARQRFERDEGIRVRDTTGDGIVGWVDPRLTKRIYEKGIRVKVETAVEFTQDPHVDGCLSASQVEDFIDHDDEDGNDNDDDDDDDDHDHDHDMEDDEEDNRIRQIEGAGQLREAVSDSAQRLSQDLNRRILAAIAARQQGMNMDINPELEAYLKELVESGHLLAASRPADGPISRPGTDTTASLPNANSTYPQSTA